ERIRHVRVVVGGRARGDVVVGGLTNLLLRHAGPDELAPLCGAGLVPSLDDGIGLRLLTGCRRRDLLPVKCAASAMQKGQRFLEASLEAPPFSSLHECTARCIFAGDDLGCGYDDSVLFHQIEAGVGSVSVGLLLGSETNAIAVSLAVLGD